MNRGSSHVPSRSSCSGRGGPRRNKIQGSELFSLKLTHRAPSSHSTGRREQAFKLRGNEKQGAESPWDDYAQNMWDTESQGAEREDPGGSTRNHSDGTPLTEEAAVGEKTEATKHPEVDEFPAPVEVLVEFLQCMDIRPKEERRDI
ncbi:hypothetical protein NDU88_003513 [Pleurodeles waltl]|uniref:Uncharacterized protein n=1 Tax=Pleurodeles waltl TaxID=8319 RepID=A0AAV7QA97_PLEWA|nr:hypothetical protein NDU88_003513 [Pleurodeles waltl]